MSLGGDRDPETQREGTNEESGGQGPRERGTASQRGRTGTQREWGTGTHRERGETAIQRGDSEPGKGDREPQRRTPRWGSSAPMTEPGPQKGAQGGWDKALTSLRMVTEKVEEMGLWLKEQSGVPRRPGLSSSSSSSREVCGRDTGRGRPLLAPHAPLIWAPLARICLPSFSLSRSHSLPSRAWPSCFWLLCPSGTSLP